MLNRQNGEFKQSFRPQNSLLENTFRPFGELAVAGIKSVFRGILPICKVLIQKKRAVVSALFCTPAGARTLDTLIKRYIVQEEAQNLPEKRQKKKDLSGPCGYVILVA